MNLEREVIRISLVKLVQRKKEYINDSLERNSFRL